MDNKIALFVLKFNIKKLLYKLKFALKNINNEIILIDLFVLSILFINKKFNKMI